LTQIGYRKLNVVMKRREKLVKKSGSYATYDEIMSQPEIWREAIHVAEGRKKEITSFFSENKFDQAIFFGCGSSYYLALAAAVTFQRFTRKTSQALPSIDLIIFPETFLNPAQNILLIPISRSGESSETVNALLGVQKRYPFKSLAVSCYEESSLVKSSDFALVLPQGKEKSIVMTRSFSSMLLLLNLMTALVSDDKTYFQELLTLPDKLEDLLKKYETSVRDIAARHDLDKFVYLGSGPYYGLACEAMLKMKEMANMVTSAHQSLEYPHGHKSTADEQTLVAFLLSLSGEEYEKRLLKELDSLGVVNLLICEKSDERIRRVGDYLIELNSGLSDFARGLLALPLLQLLAYYKTLDRGLNPDRPRNLTAVVTW
jgi:glucosamine--fructose-6-phosphate aminotransferase (isomerizing)